MVAGVFSAVVSEAGAGSGFEIIGLELNLISLDYFSAVDNLLNSAFSANFLANLAFNSNTFGLWPGAVETGDGLRIGFSLTSFTSLTFGCGFSLITFSFGGAFSFAGALSFGFA